MRPQLIAQQPHRFKRSLAPFFSWYALHDRGGDALDQGAVEQIRINLTPDQHLHQEYQDGERIGLIGRNGFNVTDQSVHGGESVCHAPIMAVPRQPLQPTRVGARPMSPARDNEEFAVDADGRTGGPVTDAARERLRRLLEVVARRESVTGDNRPKP